MIRSIWQDLRFGLRQLRLSPGFAAVGILSLGLGIGANTAIFQLIDAIRLRTMPVQKPEELATVKIFPRNWANGNFRSDYSDLTYPMWQQIAAKQEGFQTFAGWAPEQFNLARGGETKPAHGMWVTGDFFSVLGMQPLAGRLISASDDTRDCSEPAAVISYAFWQRNLGGDPTAVGKKITLNGYSVEIIGITPRKFTGVIVGDWYDVAVPVCATPRISNTDAMLVGRRTWWISSIGRLKPGWSMEQAAAQAKAISPQVMAETLPAEYDAEQVKKYEAYTLSALPAGTGVSELRETSSSGLWMLMGISALVLLIACANIANLMLARASARERELAVRLALGASRGRLVRQLLSESLMLAIGGALLGAVLAAMLSGALIDFLSTDSQQLFVDLSLSWKVLGFTTALAFVTTLLFGLVPALKATNTAPGDALKSGARGMSASREKFGLRRMLVVSQVALSLVLLVAAMLFVRSLRNLYTRDAGFHAGGVLIANLDFTRLKIPEAQRGAFEMRLVERAAAMPGVTGIAGAIETPLSDSYSNDNVLGENGERLAPARMNFVSPGYFHALGTPLLTGRDFTVEDTATSPAVAVVNQAFVDKYLGGRDALGKTFRMQQAKGDPVPVIQVVGVVKNAVYNDIHEALPPTAYFPLTQPIHPNPWVSLVVRSPEQINAVESAVKDAVASVNPEVDIEFHVFSAQVDAALKQDQLMATLTGFFGALAGLLAVIGLYGVISYTVAQRRNEIGVRMAMGAQRADVLRMVLRDAAAMVGIGLVVGAVLAFVSAKWAESMLFGLKPRDPVTYVACAVVLVAVAALASLIPARRAAQLDPWTALRDE
jgi:putative ABC transport system permease protein